MENTERSGQTRQFITFMANGQEFASNIMAIREIRGWTDTTAVPHVPDYIRGVINLRGAVLPVMDLKAKLGLGMTEASAKNVIIVITEGERTTGILVDAVSDIITLTESEIQPPPDVMGQSAERNVDGIAILDGRMVTILSAESLSAAVNDIAF
ncbi:purine-binding chemotaxis protein CheW [Rhizomicrobium palustre]|uniref:Purine-binding chemotaxis protein CheW n=1 Tax=Rhizomicrobium palustre TaxID=189966 RepID=A0A846N4C3_9PROT|nr:chemotaxis protein CheW [Rhizomicrobium palustre]NIK90483.1 purine-binding chemotaxis protein CheW [Rhizomicrobium palustre]